MKQLKLKKLKPDSIQKFISKKIDQGKTNKTIYR